jgi:hypothetical protein
MPRPPPTFRTLLLAHNIHLNIRCGHCDHRVRWTALEACERLGPDCTIVQAEQRLKCARCGFGGSEGHLSVEPCTLDISAAWAHEQAAAGQYKAVSPEADLADTLATLRQLLDGRELGGDGPVAWPEG